MAKVVITCGATGRDQATMALALAARNANPVSADEQYDIECYDDAKFNESIAPNITSANVDATHYTEILPASGHGHSGVGNTGVHVVRTGTHTSGVELCDIAENFFRLTGIGYTFAGTKASAGTTNTINIGAGSVRVTRCYLHDLNMDNSTVGIQILNALGTAFAEVANNIVRHCLSPGGANGRGINSIVLTVATVYVRNNSVLGCDDEGIRISSNASPTWLVQNNISMGSGNIDFQDDAGASAQTVQNNLSEDATADDFGGTGNLINRAIADVFVDGGTNGTSYGFCLHLQSPIDGFGRGAVLGNANPAVAAGVDLGSSAQFAVDIDGYDRDAGGVTWDIGASQLRQTGTDTTTIGTTGRDVTTLNLFKAALPANTVATGLALTQGECYADTDFDEVVDFWQAAGESTVHTNPHNRLRFTVASGHRHNGTPGAGVVIDVTSNLPQSVDMYRTGSRSIDWFYFRTTYSGSPNGGGSASMCKLVAPDCHGAWLMNYSADISGETKGFSIKNANTCSLKNSVAWDINGLSTFSSGMIAENFVASTHGSLSTACEVHNATFDDIDGYGMEFECGAGRTLYMQNIHCTRMGTSRACFFPRSGGGPGANDVDGCISDDNSADDFGGANNQIAKTHTSLYTAPDSRDYTLKTGSAGIGNGIDLGAGLLGPSSAIDITGFDRSTV